MRDEGECIGVPGLARKLGAHSSDYPDRRRRLRKRERCDAPGELAAPEVSAADRISQFTSGGNRSMKKDEPPGGLDANLIRLSVKFALSGVNAGAITFGAFVEKAYATFTDDIEELVPYLELGWDALYRRGIVEDPAADASSIVRAIRDREVSDESRFTAREIAGIRKLAEESSLTPLAPEVESLLRHWAEFSPAMTKRLREQRILVEFAIATRERFNRAVDETMRNERMVQSEAELLNAGALLLESEADEEERLARTRRWEMAAEEMFPDED